MPVISIGNLTCGGTGKTSMAARVCQELQRLDLSVCLLSRGFRGAMEHGAGVVSDGVQCLLGPAEAGDEAYLLARTLDGVPVLAGKDRRVTGRLALARFKPDALVLDDGMQFYQLYRDLDIVMLHAQEPFGNGWCLPRGLLREPPSHLRRAGLVVLSNAHLSSPGDLEKLRARVRRLAPKAAVITSRYVPTYLRPAGGGQAVEPGWLKGRRIASLCALGSPESFEETLRQAGAQLVCANRRLDHDKVGRDDLESIAARAEEAGAEALVITEKDAVKLPAEPQRLPVLSLVSRLETDDEEVLRNLLERVVARSFNR